MTKMLVKVAIALSCLAAFALGGAALAGAFETRGGPAASGDDTAKAGEAAVRAAGGGEILSVERSDDDGATWDVDVLRDGREIEVLLDERLATIGAPRVAESADAGDQPLSPDQARRAGDAALRAAGGGSVESVERSDDPGEAYEVEVTRTGRETDVTLDEEFGIVRSASDDG